MVAAAKLEGQVFDRLTVLGRNGSNKRGTALWLCRCSCGRETTVNTVDLRSGNTRSCGCLQAEARDQTTHGGVGTRLYSIWCGIKARCENPNSAIYKYYGGKGVTLCAEWQDFSRFREWAMSNGYADDLQIDREKSHLGYEPGNCEWVTKSENIARRNRAYAGVKKQRAA
jgi:hypothetical protein